MAAAFLALAWFVGIAAAAFTGVEPLAIVATSAALSALAIFVRPRGSTLLAASLAVPLIALAFIRYDATIPDASAGVALYNDAEEVVIRGVVSEEPDERSSSLVYRIDVGEIRDGETWRAQDGAVLVRTDLYRQYEYGDLLEIKGEIETPPSSSDFDYREYLLRQGVTSLAEYPETRLIEGGHGGAVESWLVDIRGSLSDALSEVLPQPHSALAGGVLFGAREDLPTELREDMAQTGTSHLVAVSGQNITMLAALMIAALAWIIGRRNAATLALVCVIGYVTLVGDDASVIRAAIMGLLYVVAILVGRPHTAPIALIYAAAAMTALDPQIVHDLSFQLSFAATLGLITLAQPLTARLNNLTNQVPPLAAVPASRALTETLGVTLAAIAFTLPITAINFHQVSLVAPLTNLFAVPAFVAVALTSAIAAGVTLITPDAAPVMAWIAWPPAEYMIRTIELAASMPGASMELRWLQVEHAIAWYAMLLAVALWLSRRPMATDEPSAAAESFRRFAPAVGLGAAAVLLFALFYPALNSDSNRVSVAVLDVGQGDAILIQDAGGHRVLIDGGPSERAITAALGRHLPFYDDRIDLLVLTHPHADHMAGLITALEYYDVGAVLTSPTTTDDPLFEAWTSALAESALPVTVAERGQAIALDGVRIDVLNPDSSGLHRESADVNDASTVLRLTAGDVSFLLTGDLTESGEEDLLASGVDLGSDVLKIGHHGSATSSSDAFLSRVDPALGVISVGAGNSFGHPARETLARLTTEKVLRTDVAGDITISTDGERIWVDTER